VYSVERGVDSRYSTRLGGGRPLEVAGSRQRGAESGEPPRRGLPLGPADSRVEAVPLEAAGSVERGAGSR
jgi:hypothetical protein